MVFGREWYFCSLCWPVKTRLRADMATEVGRRDVVGESLEGVGPFARDYIHGSRLGRIRISRPNRDLPPFPDEHNRS